MLVAGCCILQLHSCVEQSPQKKYLDLNEQWRCKIYMKQIQYSIQYSTCILYCLQNVLHMSFEWTI